MRFGDVDDHKGNAIAELLIQFVKSGSLPPKWRSSVAAEDEHDRLLLIQGGELDCSGLINS